MRLTFSFGLMLGTLLSSGAAAHQDAETLAIAAIQNACAARGATAEECTCEVDSFRSQVVPAAPEPNAAYAAALMVNMQAVDPMTLASVMRHISPQHQQATAKLMPQVMQLQNACHAPTESAVGASTPDTPGGPREQFYDQCVQEQDEPKLCACLTDKVAQSMGPDDMQLLVDIRQAEMDGAEDPLAHVAAARGLSAEEAQEAIVNNSAFMGLSWQMMSCMSAVPLSGG